MALKPCRTSPFFPSLWGTVTWSLARGQIRYCTVSRAPYALDTPLSFCIRCKGYQHTPNRYRHACPSCRDEQTNGP